jgi:Flp pilus assembly protein TadD
MIRRAVPGCLTGHRVVRRRFAFVHIHHAATLAAALMAAAAVAAPAPIAAPAAVAAPSAEAILALIDTAIAEGRYPAAGELIARARLAGDTPQLQLRTAEMFLASGDLPGAATQFSELTEAPGVAGAALQGLGLARLRQGNLPAAITALDAAIARDNSLARAWNARGVAADDMRDWPTADTAYARAIALDPRPVAALTNHGYSLMLRGRHAEAEAELVRAAALDPANRTLQTNLRFARAMQGRYKDAFAGSTREGLANDLNTVGFAAMARGDAVTAETYFNRAMQLNPHFDRTAWANLEYLKTNARGLPTEAGIDERAAKAIAAKTKR